LPGLPGGPELEPEAYEVETDDGGVIVRFGGPELLADDGAAEPEVDDTFYDNIAGNMDESQLAAIAAELLEAIENDIQSRGPWMANYERGMTLLGIEQKVATGEATGEGVSKVDHPLLLEACILAHSNACAELLPAAGPVKLDNAGRSTAITDEMALRLEQDFNEYLTVHRPEYYPDTEQGLWTQVFGGMMFKKLYHCPLRRAPVSDTVEVPDLIVNNQAKTLETAGRITHRIKMRPALLKRMQIAGAYRDVDVATPTEDINTVERKTAALQGINPSTNRQQDVDHTIYECCCELDLEGDRHEEGGKFSGLPRPYIVTIEKDSRQILEIRRNWVQDDELFTARRRYIAYRYLPMFGFYASGLLTVLGNTTSTLTAGWRIMVDSGMFANFPGGMYLKSGDRQTDNNFRAAPGEFAPIDGNGTDDIRKVAMPYPYKEPGPATQAFFEHVAETGQRVGGAANIAVAEGKADAPVGTTLAALEQVSKMIAATHRRAHQAQSLEFQTLLVLIREKPEDFVKYFEREGYWTVELLVYALDNYSLIPRADPNTPTQMHRIIKAMGLKQLEQLAPDRFDGQKVDAHIMTVALGIDDPQEFFAPPAAPGQLPPDPTLAVAQLVAQTEQAKIAQKAQADQTKAQLEAAKLRQKAEADAAKNDTTRDVTVIREQGAMQREVLKLEHQAQEAEAGRAAAVEDREFSAMVAMDEREHGAEQSQLDREHQRAESEASRTSAERVAADRNKTTVTTAKMRPKPTTKPGGK